MGVNRGGFVDVTGELLTSSLKFPHGVEIVGVDYRPDIRALRLYVRGPESAGLPIVREGEEYRRLEFIAELVHGHFRAV